MTGACRPLARASEVRLPPAEYLWGTRSHAVKPERPSRPDGMQTLLEACSADGADTHKLTRALTHEGRKGHEGPQGDEEGGPHGEPPRTGHCAPAAVLGGSGCWARAPAGEGPRTHAAHQPGQQREGTQARPWGLHAGPGVPTVHCGLHSWCDLAVQGTAGWPLPTSSGRLVLKLSPAMPLLTSAFADHKPSLVPGGPVTPGHLQISPCSFLAINPGQRGLPWGWPSPGRSSKPLPGWGAQFPLGR